MRTEASLTQRWHTPSVPRRPRENLPAVTRLTVSRPAPSGGPGAYFRFALFDQRALAALRARFERLLLDNFSARATPPLFPPNRPNSTAATFFAPVRASITRH